VVAEVEARVVVVGLTVLEALDEARVVEEAEVGATQAEPVAT